jgi:CheY-like chemotaxis protein
MPNSADLDIASLSFLVVDDEAFIQKLAVRVLGTLGATNVDTVGDGVEALAYLDSNDAEPDIMLVDLNMPIMGGVELLRKLAERNYTGAIILASGADAETLAVAEGMAKYREVNVLGYITKPVTPVALKEMLSGVNLP